MKMRMWIWVIVVAIIAQLVLQHTESVGSFVRQTQAGTKNDAGRWANSRIITNKRFSSFKWKNYTNLWLTMQLPVFFSSSRPWSWTNCMALYSLLPLLVCLNIKFNATNYPCLPWQLLHLLEIVERLRYTIGSYDASEFKWVRKLTHISIVSHRHAILT